MMGSQVKISGKRVSELAVAEVFDVLYRNSLRATFGDDEEENQKLALSHQCVSFLL